MKIQKLEKKERRCTLFVFKCRNVNLFNSENINATFDRENSLSFIETVKTNKKGNL